MDDYTDVRHQDIHWMVVELNTAWNAADNGDSEAARYYIGKVREKLLSHLPELEMVEVPRVTLENALLNIQEAGGKYNKGDYHGMAIASQRVETKLLNILDPQDGTFIWGHREEIQEQIERDAEQPQPFGGD